MKAIPVPETLVTPIEEIAKGVSGLRIAFVNVFSIEHYDGSWTLLDAGLPFSDGSIRRWAEDRFKRAPNAIVLTHGHFDHVSSAAALAEGWDVPIYAHPLEFPYLMGEREYPAPNAGAGGGLMSLLSPLLPKGPVNLAERLLPLTTESMARSVAALPGWVVLHTPGHTPGHISLFRPEDRMLLAGDAFCTTKPESFFDAAIAQPVELHGPPAYFTSDWDAARHSVRQLAALQPAIVAPGHGKPLRGPGVSDALRILAREFDAVAVPDNRK